MTDHTLRGFAWTRLCLGAALLAAAFGALAAQPEPAASGAPCPPTPQASLNLLAEQAGRPAWGPLLVLQGHAAFLPLVRHALASPLPEQRARGLLLLGFLGIPGTAPLAERGLTDPQQAVRKLAALALVLLGQEQGVAQTEATLDKSEEWQRYYALYALWAHNSRAAKLAIQRAPTPRTPLLATCLHEAQVHPRSRPLAPVIIPLPGDLRQMPQSLQGLWETVADSFVLESDWWWHAGNYDQAIRCQETSIFFDPALVEAYSNIAWLQWSMGRTAQAVLTYRRCIRANPRSWEAAQDLGMHYVRVKQPEKALPYLRQAAALGSPAIKRRQLGHVLEGLGRWDEARAVWEQILKLDPSDFVAKRQLQRLQSQH
jgi:tetratricopeptide (TPR) repeat protein